MAATASNTYDDEHGRTCTDGGRGEERARQTGALAAASRVFLGSEDFGAGPDVPPALPGGRE